MMGIGVAAQTKAGSPKGTLPRWKPTHERGRRTQNRSTLASPKPAANSRNHPTRTRAAQTRQHRAHYSPKSNKTAARDCTLTGGKEATRAPRPQPQRRRRANPGARKALWRTVAASPGATAGTGSNRNPLHAPYTRGITAQTPATHYVCLWAVQPLFDMAGRAARAGM